MPDPVHIPDADKRRRIEEDLDINLFVEAGAGSGKTASLVRRITALLVTGRAEMGQIAAITFTRKAAAELRQRLQEHLEESIRKETDPEHLQRLNQATAAMGEAFIGTVHSFCGRLLREHPFEAGLDPGFVELEPEADARVQEEAWQEYLARLQAEQPEILELLDEMGASASDLYEAYRLLAQYPEVEPVTTDKTDPPDLNEPRRRLAGFLAALKKLFPPARPESGWDKLQEAVLFGENMLGIDAPGARRRIYRVYEELEKDLKITLKNWASQDAGREARDMFHRYQSETVAPVLKAWREYCHGRLVDSLRGAVRFATEYRRQSGQLNYEDLLQRAAALLREHPAVRRRLGRKYTHLFVDEFQDTDPVQAEVMFLLTGEPLDEADWRRLRPRPGSLFVVGDPKQSIYRFRRADIAVYQEVKNLMAASGGSVLLLTANFRSLPAVAGRVSESMHSILPETGNRYQAAFAPLEPIRPEGTAACGVYKISIPAVPRHVKAGIVRMDAARIAAWIAWACAGNLRLDRKPAELAEGLTPEAQPGDFLILTPYRSRLGVYVAALEEAGLPVETAGARALARTERVRWFLQICAALADPDDQMKLLACLRGPCFGLSDLELYDYRAAGGRFGFLHVPEEDRSPVAGVLRRLHEYWRWTRTEPSAAAAEMILEDLGLLPHAAAGKNGASEAGALLSVLEALRGAGEDEAASFARAVAVMQSAAANDDRDVPSLIPANSGCVRVMNLHKAKGLEAPVVFLADPTARTDHDPDCHVDRQGARSSGYFLFTRPMGQFGQRVVIGQPPGWEEAVAEERRFQEAEADRLLYVAATRAKNLLIISRYEGKPEADPWAKLAPALGDIPELDEVEPPQVNRPILEADPNTAEADLAQVAERLAAAARPGYQTGAVTRIAHRRRADEVEGEAEVAPAFEEAGATVESIVETETPAARGPSWGTSFHRIMARISQGLPRNRWETVARRILEEEGRSPDEAGELAAEAGKVWDSPLGERIRGAREVLCEVPFGLETTARELGLPEDEGPERVVLNGVIDLALREEDSWVLLDYKTDAAATDKLEDLTAYYAPQLRLYARFWREQYGVTVKEAVLFFTMTGQIAQIDISSTNNN